MPGMTSMCLASPCLPPPQAVRKGRGPPCVADLSRERLRLVPGSVLDLGWQQTHLRMCQDLKGTSMSPFIYIKPLTCTARDWPLNSETPHLVPDLLCLPHFLIQTSGLVMLGESLPLLKPYSSDLINGLF